MSAPEVPIISGGSERYKKNKWGPTRKRRNESISVAREPNVRKENKETTVKRELTFRNITKLGLIIVWMSPRKRTILKTIVINI